MFSRRTSWESGPSALAALLAARSAADGEVLDLTETNPTRAGLLAPPGLLEGLGDDGGRRYAPEPRGLSAAREAVAADFRRRGAEVEPDGIVLTASTSEAYAFLFKLLCDAGDGVLVPRPSYPLFEYLAGLESVEVGHYPLRYDGEWHLAPGAVEQAAGTRTRAVVAVSPNNPTGSFLKRDEAAGLQEVCARHGWALIADEVFADYPLRPDPRRCPTVAGPGPALAVALGGLSKSCGLPQLKLAWMAVGGPRDRREEALRRLDVVADTYLSVSTPVQRIAPALLARQAELRRPIAERVAGNLARLRAAAQGTAATVLDVEGGWSAVLRVPSLWPDERWALSLLERDGVLVHPGYFFDFEDEACLVLSLLVLPETFERGLARVLARVERGLDEADVR